MDPDATALRDQELQRRARLRRSGKDSAREDQVDNTWLDKKPVMVVGAKRAEKAVVSLPKYFLGSTSVTLSTLITESSRSLSWISHDAYKDDAGKIHEAEKRPWVVPPAVVLDAYKRMLPMPGFAMRGGFLTTKGSQSYATTHAPLLVDIINTCPRSLFNKGILESAVENAQTEREHFDIESMFFAVRVDARGSKSKLGQWVDKVEELAVANGVSLDNIKKAPGVGAVCLSAVALVAFREEDLRELFEWADASVQIWRLNVRERLKELKTDKSEYTASRNHNFGRIANQPQVAKKLAAAERADAIKLAEIQRQNPDVKEIDNGEVQRVKHDVIGSIAGKQAHKEVFGAGRRVKTRESQVQQRKSRATKYEDHLEDAWDGDEWIKEPVRYAVRPAQYLWKGFEYEEVKSGVKEVLHETPKTTTVAEIAEQTAAEVVKEVVVSAVGATGVPSPVAHALVDKVAERFSKLFAEQPEFAKYFADLFDPQPGEEKIIDDVDFSYAAMPQFDIMGALKSGWSECWGYICKKFAGWAAAIVTRGAIETVLEWGVEASLSKFCMFALLVVAAVRRDLVTFGLAAAAFVTSFDGIGKMIEKLQEFTSTSDEDLITDNGFSFRKAAYKNMIEFSQKCLSRTDTGEFTIVSAGHFSVSTIARTATMPADCLKVNALRVGEKISYAEYAGVRANWQAAFVDVVTQAVDGPSMRGVIHFLFSALGTTCEPETLYEMVQMTKVLHFANAAARPVGAIMTAVLTICRSAILKCTDVDVQDPSVTLRVALAKRLIVKAATVAPSDYVQVMEVGQDMLSLMSEADKLPRHVSTLLATQWNKFYETFTTAVRLCHEAPTRTKPVNVIFLGESGGGKSTFGRNLGYILAEYVTGHAASSVDFYSLRPGQEQFDGYNGQAVLTYDEILTSDEEEHLTQFTDFLLAAVSMDRHVLHCAAMHKKDCTFFSSPFMIGQTNRENITRQQLQVVSGDAVYNRFALYVRMRQHADTVLGQKFVVCSQYIAKYKLHLKLKLVSVIAEDKWMHPFKGLTEKAEQLPCYEVNLPELAVLCIALYEAFKAEQNKWMICQDDVATALGAVRASGYVPTAPGEYQSRMALAMTALAIASGESINVVVTDNVVATDEYHDARAQAYVDVAAMAARHNVQVPTIETCFANGTLTTCFQVFLVGCVSATALWGIFKLWKAFTETEEPEEELLEQQSVFHKRINRHTAKRMGDVHAQGFATEFGYNPRCESVVAQSTSNLEAVVLADARARFHYRLAYKANGGVHISSLYEGVFCGPRLALTVNHFISGHADLAYMMISAPGGGEPNEDNKLYFTGENPIVQFRRASHVDQAWLWFGNDFPQRASIYKRLAPENVFDDLKGQRIYSTRLRGEMVTMIPCTVDDNSAGLRYPTEFGTVQAPGSLTIGLHTVQGDCGNLYYYPMNGAAYVVAVHTAGGTPGACGQIITKEMVDSVPSWFGQPTGIVEPQAPNFFEPNPTLGMQIEPAEGSFHGMEIAGEITGTCSSMMTLNTKAKRSPLFGIFGPQPYAPATYRSKLPDGRNTAAVVYSKMGQPHHKMEEPKHKKRIFEQLFRWYPRPTGGGIVLSEKDAVMGSKYYGLEPVNKHTSPGPAWAGSTKEDHMRYDREAGTYWLSNALRSAIDYRETCAKRGERVVNLWKDAWKDELRKCEIGPTPEGECPDFHLHDFDAYMECMICREVALNVTKEDFNARMSEQKCLKPRVFSVGGMDATIVCRKYLGHIMGDAYKRVPIGPITIGINPHSWHWGAIWARLCRSSPYVSESDFAGFDGSIPAFLMKAQTEWINQWYGDSEENQMARSVLLAESVYSFHMAGRVVYHGKGRPSGEPLTGFGNSICVLIAILDVMIDLAIEYNIDDGRFERYWAVVANGDDNSGEAALTIGDFPWVQLPRKMMEMYGMKMTSAAKVGNFDVVASRDMMYLSRRFEWREGYCYAPLKEQRLLAMLYWVRDDEPRTLKAMVYQFCIEAVHHGRAWYEKYANKLAAHWWVRDNKVRVLSFQDATFALHNEKQSYVTGAMFANDASNDVHAQSGNSGFVTKMDTSKSQTNTAKFNFSYIPMTTNNNKGPATEATETLREVNVITPAEVTKENAVSFTDALCQEIVSIDLSVPGPDGTKAVTWPGVSDRWIPCGEFVLSSSDAYYTQDIINPNTAIASDTNFRRVCAGSTHMRMDVEVMAKVNIPVTQNGYYILAVSPMVMPLYNTEITALAHLPHATIVGNETDTICIEQKFMAPYACVPVEEFFLNPNSNLTGGARVHLLRLHPLESTEMSTAVTVKIPLYVRVKKLELFNRSGDFALEATRTTQYVEVHPQSGNVEMKFVADFIEMDSDVTPAAPASAVVKPAAQEQMEAALKGVDKIDREQQNHASYMKYYTRVVTELLKRMSIDEAIECGFNPERAGVALTPAQQEAVVMYRPQAQLLEVRLQKGMVAPARTSWDELKLEPKPAKVSWAQDVAAVRKLVEEAPPVPLKSAVIEQATATAVAHDSGKAARKAEGNRSGRPKAACAMRESEETKTLKEIFASPCPARFAVSVWGILTLEERTAFMQRAKPEDADYVVGQLNPVPVRAIALPNLPVRMAEPRTWYAKLWKNVQKPFETKYVLDVHDDFFIPTRFVPVQPDPPRSRDTYGKYVWCQGLYGDAGGWVWFEATAKGFVPTARMVGRTIVATGGEVVKIITLSTLAGVVFMGTVVAIGGIVNLLTKNAEAIEEEEDVELEKDNAEAQSAPPSMHSISRLDTMPMRQALSTQLYNSQAKSQAARLDAVPEELTPSLVMDSSEDFLNVDRMGREWHLLTIGEFVNKSDFFAIPISPNYTERLVEANGLTYAMYSPAGLAARCAKYWRAKGMKIRVEISTTKFVTARIRVTAVMGVAADVPRPPGYTNNCDSRVVDVNGYTVFEEYVTCWLQDKVLRTDSRATVGDAPGCSVGCVDLTLDSDIEGLSGGATQHVRYTIWISWDGLELFDPGFYSAEEEGWTGWPASDVRAQGDILDLRQETAAPVGPVGDAYFSGKKIETFYDLIRTPAKIAELSDYGDGVVENRNNQLKFALSRNRWDPLVMRQLSSQATPANYPVDHKGMYQHHEYLISVSADTVRWTASTQNFYAQNRRRTGFPMYPSIFDIISAQLPFERGSHNFTVQAPPSGTPTVSVGQPGVVSNDWELTLQAMHATEAARLNAGAVLPAPTALGITNFWGEPGLLKPGEPVVYAASSVHPSVEVTLGRNRASFFEYARPAVADNLGDLPFFPGYTATHAASGNCIVGNLYWTEKQAYDSIFLEIFACPGDDYALSGGYVRPCPVPVTQYSASTVRPANVFSTTVSYTTMSGLDRNDFLPHRKASEAYRKSLHRQQERAVMQPAVLQHLAAAAVTSDDDELTAQLESGWTQVRPNKTLGIPSGIH